MSLSNVTHKHATQVPAKNIVGGVRVNRRLTWRVRDLQNLLNGLQV